MSNTTPSKESSQQESFNPPNFTDGPFTDIPNVIFDYWQPRIKPRSFLLLTVVCRMTFGVDIDSPITRKELAERTGFGKYALSTAIKELKFVGLLLMIQSRSLDGSQFENIFYELNLNEEN